MTDVTPDPELAVLSDRVATLERRLAAEHADCLARDHLRRQELYEAYDCLTATLDRTWTHRLANWLRL